MRRQKQPIKLFDTVSRIIRVIKCGPGGFIAVDHIQLAPVNESLRPR